MIRSRLFVAPIAIWMVVLQAAAQSPATRRDSLKQVIAGHRSQMLLADSIGDPKGSIRARLELAPLVSPGERLHLLEDAAAGAQSASLLEEEVTVRKLLAAALESAGKYSRAYDEAMHITALDEVRLSEQHLRSKAFADSLQASATVARERLDQGWQIVLQDAQSRASGFKAIAERWVLIALGLGAAWALTVVIFLVSQRRQRNRTRTELAALRAEIAAIKEAPKNRFREPVPTVVVEPPPVEVLAPAAPIGAPVVDAAALAIFRRMAPERLDALNDARARGDHDKVLRVVHTLKPHLEALDPNGLGALCLRIKAMDVPERDVELDRLVHGIQELLR